MNALSHVRVEHNHYSVPDGHIGRTVAARVGGRMVEVFLDRGAERIAVHRRNSGRNQYATHPAHMPERLQAVRDIRKPDYGDILLSRARRIGRNALAWSERCFASRVFPEQAFTTVQGMVRLADDHGRERIDALCAEALDLTCGHPARLRIRSVESWRWPACCMFRAPKQRISAHFDALTSSERPDQFGSSERFPGPYSFRQVVLTRADGD